MPWGKRTPNGRFQGERPEQKISKTFIASTNEVLASGAGDGAAFGYARTKVQELIAKNTEGKKG